MAKTPPHALFRVPNPMSYILPPRPLLDLRTSPARQRHIHRRRPAADDHPHHVLRRRLVERLVLGPRGHEGEVSRRQLVASRLRVLVCGTSQEDTAAGDCVYDCIYTRILMRNGA